MVSKKILLWGLGALHLLNLDVVLGAIIGYIFFAKLPNRYGEINIPTMIVLGACTWIIYIIDRLLDNLKPIENQTVRHHFHAKYQKQLLILVGFLLIISIVFLFYLPTEVFYLGLKMAIPLVIYFFLFLYFKINFIKEPITAIFYTIAVAGTALITHEDLRRNDLLLMLNYGLIAFQNLLLFSLFETYSDKARQNLVSKIGTKFTLFLIILITIFIFSSEFFFFKNINLYQSICFFIEVFMTFVLLIISLLPKIFLQNETYRWLADGVFFIPILVMF
jgi:hypothetical protein